VVRALAVLSQVTGGIGPQRLHPFVPELLNRLAHYGELRIIGAGSSTRTCTTAVSKGGITFTRSRAWKKNDSAHIESKFARTGMLFGRASLART
jgi:hypothetical protein